MGLQESTGITHELAIKIYYAIKASYFYADGKRACLALRSHSFQLGPFYVVYCYACFPCFGLDLSWD